MSAQMSEWKQQALTRFERWLAELPDEAASECAAEESVDLYTLAEELTALKQEMRTLGRTTAKLADSSQQVSDTLREELPSLLKAAPVAAGVPDKEALVQVRREAVRPFLVELGDLSGALDEVSARNIALDWPFYVPKRVRQQLEQAQGKSLDILKQRINALLSRHALKPMVAVGDGFAPATMNAAGTSDKGSVPPGCVSAVVQQGYVCGEEVIRFAEVIVEETV